MSGSLINAPTATMTISSGAAGVFPIGFGYYPAEGSRCISAQYNFANQALFVEDLSQLVAKGIETSIQGVFIDNTLNSSTLRLQVFGTGQVVGCPATAQGVFPLFFTGTPGFQIYVPAAGNYITRCYFLNVPPQSAGTWFV